MLDKKIEMWLLILALIALGPLVLSKLSTELTPREDRGAFLLFIKGPEGASYNYMLQHAAMIEERLQHFVSDGAFQRLLLRVPGSFEQTESFNDAIGIVVMSPWDSGRHDIQYYVNEVRKLTNDIPGVTVFPVVRQAFGRRAGKPVQLVLGGANYETLLGARDTLIQAASRNPGLVGIDSDYNETKPHIGIEILRARAADLGVSIEAINRTLETLLGSRRVTTFTQSGQEYDVILEIDKSFKQSPDAIEAFAVRGDASANLVPLSNLIELSEFADAKKLNHYNRLRSITIESNLTDDYRLSDALAYLESLLANEVNEDVTINYKGESEALKETTDEVIFIFLLVIIVAFLVLAAQFESFVLPLVIMTTVPLSITGALCCLWLMNQTLNIYSQVGLIILVGLAAKNGILIVEFVNQLRDAGISFRDAIIEAAGKRFRPIVMTGITTAMGAFPLVIASGAGSEARVVIGLIIFSGVLFALIYTLFVIPFVYYCLADGTSSPSWASKALKKALEEEGR